MLSPKHAAQHTKNIELHHLGLLELLHLKQDRSQIAADGAGIWMTNTKRERASLVQGSHRRHRVFGMPVLDESSQSCTLGCELDGIRLIRNSQVPRLCQFPLHLAGVLLLARLALRPLSALLRPFHEAQKMRVTSAAATRAAHSDGRRALL